MKITNQDKKFISKMIDYYSKLHPIDDSAEYQNIRTDFAAFCSEVAKDSIRIEDKINAIEDITSCYHFILGMKLYRAIGFMIDNPLPTIELLFGADDTIIY